MLIPSVALGAIVAALIAGLVSLLGLIISKEQKTSEFRQAWIDSLRADLISYLTQINAIRDAAQIPFKDHTAKVDRLAPLYTALNTATFSVSLRINPTEKRCERLLISMSNLGSLSRDVSSYTPDNIRPLEAEFISASQDLLKYEWGRVKRGESTFMIAKIAALAVVILSIGTGLYTAWSAFSTPVDSVKENPLTPAPQEPATRGPPEVARPGVAEPRR